MKFRSLAVAAVAALSLTAIAACGSSDDTKDAADSGPKTIDVWLMKGSVSDDFLKRFEADFAAKHPDVKANVQIQEWNGIGPKIIGALASKDAPDVIEVGNTQVAQYSASGGVSDLTDKKADLKGDDWIEGLAGPGLYEGKQYGIPYYAANRVVVYRKDLFAAAGVTPPKTRDEWITTTTKLNAGGNQGIYLPGQNFYVLSGFIWDEGGDLAVKDGDQWKGGLSSPEAQKGMDFYQQIQALGKGPKDSDEAKPTQTDVFAQGKIAQMIAVPGAAELIAQANPALKDKLGFFPIPGKTADKPGAVFTGGSDLIIPVASDAPGRGVHLHQGTGRRAVADRPGQDDEVRAEPDQPGLVGRLGRGRRGDGGRCGQRQGDPELAELGRGRGEEPDQGVPDQGADRR